MLGDLFQFLGAYLRQRVRHLVVTAILLGLGSVLILLALGMGLWVLYLWLQIELGTFAALGILAGTFALAGAILLAVAFRRSGTNGRVARNVIEAEREAPPPARARKRSPRNGRDSFAVITILVTLVLGWIAGRRTRR